MGTFLLLCVLLIFTIVFFAIGYITKKYIFAQAVVVAWAFIILLGVFSFLVRPFSQKKVLDPNDFYGTYIIDRTYFKGKQADWQYNHYRFEIKENNIVYFYETNGAEIVKIYKGTATFIETYPSARLAIYMEPSSYHITKTAPTVYRDIWNFILVFNSDKFSNMYFKKGTWQALNN